MTEEQWQMTEERWQWEREVGSKMKTESVFLTLYETAEGEISPSAETAGERRTFTFRISTLPVRAEDGSAQPVWLARGYEIVDGRRVGIKWTAQFATDPFAEIRNV